MQTPWFWSLLPFLLLISQITATTEAGGKKESGEEYFDASDSDSDNQDENDRSLTNLNSFVGAALPNFYEFISNGNKRYNSYSFVAEKLFDLAQFGGDRVNPMDVLRFIPFITFAIEQANQNFQTETISQDTWKNMEMDEFSLVGIMKSPNLFKKFCLKPGRAKVLDNALKVIAGEEAYDAINALAKELKTNLTDIKLPSGKNIRGIGGDKLTQVAQNSVSFKKLFSTKEVVAYALNMINAQMSEYLSIEVMEAEDVLVKRNILVEGDEDEELSIILVAEDTLRFSSQVFLGKAKRKIDQTLQPPDQKKSTGLGANLQRTASNLYSKITSMSFGPADKYYKVVPQITSYVLPDGMGFNAFRFICLMTYVSLVAHRENVNIPKLPEEAATIPGFDADSIIKSLGNRGLMEKIYMQDPNSTSTALLKFITWPEADLVQMIVPKLQDYASSIGKKIGDLEINEVLDNLELFQIFLSLDEFKLITLRTLSSAFYHMQK